jgi:riboflavin synthase
VFTGLIREIGTLKRVARTGGVTRVEVRAPRTAAGARAGDSVAVDGICLTVTRTFAGGFAVDAAHETGRLTTLETWRAGRRVHLEPALRAGDPLDGHLVQGHVDGTGTIRKVAEVGGSWLMTVALSPEQARFLTPKGSVAVDGVSLTVDAGPFDGCFTVNIIPHTWRATTFAAARPGRKVNLEMDVLVKAARGGGWRDLPSLDPGADRGENAPLTMERLLGAGFGRARGRK